MSSYGEDKLVEVGGNRRRVFFWNRNCSGGCEWYRPGEWWPWKLWAYLGWTVRALWKRGRCTLWKRRLRYSDETTSIGGELHHARNDVRCDECLEARNVERP